MVVCSLISGIDSLDTATSGRKGLRTMCYYVSTTTLSVRQGFCWIYAIRPGINVRLSGNESFERKESSSVDGFLDMIMYDCGIRGVSHLGQACKRKVQSNFMPN